MSSLLLFFMSALGAFNGLLLSLFLFLSKPRTTQRLFLGSLLLVISLRISKSIWFFYHPDIGKQFLQIGLSACFLIGPFMYFYATSVIDKEAVKRTDWRWHLATLILILLIAGSVYPYQTHIALWGKFYSIINYTWGVYLLLAGLKLKNLLNTYIQDKTKLNGEQKLCLHVYIGTCLIWLAYFTASYTSYIVGALSFSFIVYVSALIWLLPKMKGKVTEKKTSYANKQIEQEVINRVEVALAKLMDEAQLYKDPNLSLPTLAKKLQISVPQLSQILNDNFNQSFANYVNQRRIEEAKRLLIENKRMTMEQIAELSGYNSQSTFYASFKQFVDCTPAKYRTKTINTHT